jgi:zinc transporter 1
MPISEDDDIGSEIVVLSSKEKDHHEHRHRIFAKKARSKSQHQDYGMAGVILHLAGDAFNNMGVIIAGLVIWKTTSPNRFYADPAVSLVIALMILLSSLPLVKRTGHILLQSPPDGLDVADIKHDLEKIPGVASVHELHVWRLNQQKALASAHVVIDDPSLENFQLKAKTINECLHAYGVHSVTIQPELRMRKPPVAPQPSDPAATTQPPSIPPTGAGAQETPNVDGTTEEGPNPCLMNCGTHCEKMTCCG